MYAPLFGARARRRHRRGAGGNLLVYVRSDLVDPGHSRRGPCFRPGAPRPPPRACGACPSCWGSPAPWPSPLLPVSTLPALKVTLPLKLENLYTTRAHIGRVEEVEVLPNSRGPLVLPSASPAQDCSGPSEASRGASSSCSRRGPSSRHCGNLHVRRWL